MDSSARDTYLEAQVRTANPPQLRLMLLDAAVRWVHATREALAVGDTPASVNTVIRAREIICELISGIRTDGGELSKKVLALYGYLFEKLTVAQIQQNLPLLDEVLELLEYDRETWRLVCQQFTAQQAESSSAHTAPPPPRGPIIPTDPTIRSAGTSESLLLDA